MNLETKITIYKFTPQVFTLTRFFLLSWYPTNVFPGKGRSTMPDYPAANVQTMP